MRKLSLFFFSTLHNAHTHILPKMSPANPTDRPTPQHPFSQGTVGATSRTMLWVGEGVLGVVALQSLLRRCCKDTFVVGGGGKWTEEGEEDKLSCSSGWKEERGGGGGGATMREESEREQLFLSLEGRRRREVCLHASSLFFHSLLNPLLPSFQSARPARLSKREPIGAGFTQHIARILLLS